MTQFTWELSASSTSFWQFATAMYMWYVVANIARLVRSFQDQQWTYIRNRAERIRRLMED